MKVKFIGNGSPLTLLTDKIYKVMSVEGKWFRIVDETNEDYCYRKELFEIVEE